MKNLNIPTNTELPSMGKLIKSTILAIVIASIILVTVVLPAEYGVDPTGIGSAIGLLKMGEIKVSLAQEAAEDRVSVKIPEAYNVDDIKPAPKAVAEKATDEADPNTRSDELSITLKPNEGKEIKLTMTKGATVNYFWSTDGGQANFDAHADSKKLEIKYHNYSKGKSERSEGDLEAAFDGNHGWFWRNRTSKTMTVTLKVSGAYSDIVKY